MSASASKPRSSATTRPCVAAAKAAMQRLFRAGLDSTSTVVLVGSAARGTRTAQSDVDLLVLNEDGRRIAPSGLGDTHLQQESRTGFLRRLADGDDYPAWALRWGVPLRDTDGWWARQAAAERAEPHWPDWHAKVDCARKRMQLAAELLDTGDVDAANEELLFAASHIARAVLLRAGKFPLSRPELPDQLRALDDGLAVLLRRLIFGEADAGDWRPAAATLEDRLAHLTEAHNADA